MTFGSVVTLTDMIIAFKGLGEQFLHIVQHLLVVAHPQVRDMSSWAGNLMIAKRHRDFPSDLMVSFTMLKATLTIDNGMVSRTSSVDDFLAGAELGPKEIITKLSIKKPDAADVLDSFKILRRHRNTHRGQRLRPLQVQRRHGPGGPDRRRPHRAGAKGLHGDRQGARRCSSDRDRRGCR